MVECQTAAPEEAEKSVCVDGQSGGNQATEQTRKESEQRKDLACQWTGAVFSFCFSF